MLMRAVVSATKHFELSTSATDFPRVPLGGDRYAARQEFHQHPSVFGVIAEADDGQTLGFNFLSERDPIRAVGPIVVDPMVQGKG